MGQVIDHNKMKSALFYVPLVFFVVENALTLRTLYEEELVPRKKGQTKKKNAEEQLEKDSQSFTAKY